MIQATIDEKKASALRKYLAEIVIIGLAGAIGFLFVRMDDLNKYIRDTLVSSAARTENVIQANTAALQLLTRELEEKKDRKN